VRIVVADPGPINYLVLIGQSEILPALFEKVIIRAAVRDELIRVEAPEAVRSWMNTPPAWLELHPHSDGPFEAGLENLDEGEKAALILAVSFGADLLLLDDREVESIERLKRANFRYRQEIMDKLLDQQQRDP
jgi:predicted nucleic acid-binding protein